MKNILIVLLSFAGLLAHAQPTSQKPAGDTSVAKELSEITLDTIEVIAPCGPAPFQSTAPRVWEIKNIRIALSFNMEEKTADAREWIKLRPYFYGTDTLMLDAKGIRLDSIRLLGKAAGTKFTYSNMRDQLRIQFARMMFPSDSIELYLRYTSRPYASPTGGSSAITDDRGLYFINTDHAIPNKPVEIWTQGETESNSRWMVTIDKPNSRFTTQIELTVPDSFKTLSNGYFISSVYQPRQRLRTDVWRMDIPIQAYAVMFAIGKFSVVRDKWRNKEVNYYVEPEYAPYARLMFNNTPEMMEYFSRRTGVSYPWNKYSQVVVRDYVSGAMENTTASLFGEFMNQNAREIADKNSEDVVAHELFHQWFGDYVTAESWSNITVNESFANYGEQLWRTYKYGKAASDELAWNDLQLYINATRLSDPQLVRYYYDSREEVFDAISYNKGGAILHYLNTLIGDAAFDRAMNIYLTKNALGSAEAHDWRKAVEEATGQDWSWFFNEWYYHAGHPELKVTYNYSDSLQQLTVAVAQTQNDSDYMYKLPLKAAVIYGNEKTIVNWKINDSLQSFIYKYRNGVKPVVVPDYDHVLVGELKETKKPEQWLVQYRNSDDYVNKRLAVAAAAKIISDSSSQEIVSLSLGDKLPSIRRHALVAIKAFQSDKYRRRWTNRVADMAVNDSNRLVRAEAFDVLGTWKVASAKQSMLRALSDSSYAVAGNALEALSKIDADTAYLLARQILPSEPKATLETAVWTIIGKKAADDDIVLFEKKAPFVFGTKKFAFAYSLGRYMKNVKSDESFKRAADVYTSLVTTESMKSYRAALAGMFFQAAAGLKSEAKSDNKEEAAIAQRRLDMLKGDLQHIIRTEKDPDAAKELKKMMAKTYES
jgi:aminopeptidase N